MKMARPQCDTPFVFIVGSFFGELYETFHILTVAGLKCEWVLTGWAFVEEPAGFRSQFFVMNWTTRLVYSSKD
jgi:hypothetical protein